MAYLLVVMGLVGLFVGGELVVRGAVGISERFKLSPLLVGLTVVAFAGSLPDLLVSLDSALQGQTDSAVSNVVGSSIANLLLVLGLVAVIRPIVLKTLSIKRDVLMMLGSTVVLVILAQLGIITHFEGIIMIALLIAYVAYSYYKDKKEKQTGNNEDEENAPKSASVSIVFLVLGFVALTISSNMLVTGATDIATMLNVPERIVSLTIVALGLAFPELTIAVLSAIHGHPTVAVGNVIGSTIFNILWVLGLMAAITTVHIPVQIAHFDVWLLLAAVVVVATLLLWRHKLGRFAGVTFLVLYVGYTLLLYYSGKTV